MKTIQRWIGGFLTIIMLLCMLPAVHIQAADAETVTCLIDTAEPEPHGLRIDL